MTTHEKKNPFSMDDIRKCAEASNHEQYATALKAARLAAIKECMEAVPEEVNGDDNPMMSGYVRGFNTSRSQTLANLERLLHTDEIS